MLNQENQYLDLLKELVKESEKGNLVQDRTGVGTYNLFNRYLRFDISKEFPLLTTKKMSIKSILGEMLWFISGSTNALELEEQINLNNNGINSQRPESRFERREREEREYLEKMERLSRSFIEHPDTETKLNFGDENT